MKKVSSTKPKALSRRNTGDETSQQETYEEGYVEETEGYDDECQEEWYGNGAYQDEEEGYGEETYLEEGYADETDEGYDDET